MLAILSSAVSFSFSNFSSISDFPLQFAKQQFSNADSENEETTAHGAPFNYSSFLFSINGTFQIKSVDIIVHKSRICDNVEKCIGSFDASSSKQLSEHGADYGIWISIRQTSVDMSCKEGKVTILSNLSEIQSSIFRYKNRRGKSTDHSVLSDLLLQSLDCIYELSLSSCEFNLSLFLSQNCPSVGSVNNTLDTSSSVGETMHMENFPSANSDSTGHQYCSFIQGSELASNIPPPGSSHWLLVNVTLGKIYMGRCSARNVMNGAHQLNKFLSSVSVGGEFQTVDCGIEVIFLFFLFCTF